MTENSEKDDIKIRSKAIAHYPTSKHSEITVTSNIGTVKVVDDGRAQPLTQC